MTITYRSVKGSRLTVAEADGNIADHEGRIAALEAAPGGDPYLVINPDTVAAPAVPTATGRKAMAAGDGAVANADFAIALGEDSTATGQQALAVGSNADATEFATVALGTNCSATANSATALGRASNAGHASSTAVGYGATTTKANQVVLGTASEEVTVPGTLVATGAISSAGAVSSESAQAVARLSNSAATCRLNLFNTSNNFSVLKEADYLAIGLTGSETSGLVLDSTGAVATGGDSLKITTAKTPASAAATGVAGQIAWDTNFIYVCVATNTWKRVAIATWT